MWATSVSATGVAIDVLKKAANRQHHLEANASNMEVDTAAFKRAARTMRKPKDYAQSTGVDFVAMIQNTQIAQLRHEARRAGVIATEVGVDALSQIALSSRSKGTENVDATHYHAASLDLRTDLKVSILSASGLLEGQEAMVGQIAAQN